MPNGRGLGLWLVVVGCVILRPSGAVAQPSPPPALVASAMQIWTAPMRAAVVGVLVQRADNSETAATGFLIGDGYMVTAAHVVTQQLDPCDQVARQHGLKVKALAKPDSIAVYRGPPDDRGPAIRVIPLNEYPSSVQPIRYSDIAVVNIGRPVGVQPLTMDFSYRGHVPDKVAVYGYPLKDRGQADPGKLIDTKPNYLAPVNSISWALQITSEDVESGAPVVDSNGRVVAVMSCGNEQRQYVSPIRAAYDYIVNIHGLQNPGTGLQTSTPVVRPTEPIPPLTTVNMVLRGQCSTTATGLNGVTHNCTSSPRLTAPAGFVFNVRPIAGGELSGNGKSHGCGYEFSDFVAASAQSAAKLPRVVTLNVRAQGPSGHFAGHGWEICAYTFQAIKQ